MIPPVPFPATTVSVSLSLVVSVLSVGGIVGRVTRKVGPRDGESGRVMGEDLSPVVRREVEGTVKCRGLSDPG